jgi:hypothetical protein
MKPNGRDYTTNPVLKRLAKSDHTTLILACRLQARSPNTKGFQIIDVYDDDRDDGCNQGHISDVGVSRTESDDTGTVPTVGSGTAPPTEEQQVSTDPASEGNVENLVLVEPQLQGTNEVPQAMYHNSSFGLPPLRDPLPLRSDGKPDFTQRLIKVCRAVGSGGGKRSRR